MEIKPLINEDYIILDEEAMLSELMGKLQAFEKRVGLVFKKDKYLGLIEKKWLLKSRLDVSKTKLKSYVQKTPIINENADIIETAYLMYQSNLDYVPVESNKKIIGVLSGLDLAGSSLNLDEMNKVKVSDIKFIKPSKLNKDDPIGAALKVMYEEKIDVVPIFDKGQLYGIVSFKDIIRKYLNWTPNRDNSTKFNKEASSKSAAVDMPHLASLPISNFSTNDNLMTIMPSEGINKALPKMIKNNINNLLVMEDNVYVGLLTVKSLLRKVASLKIPKNYNIKFIGLKEVKLLPHQKYNFQKIASNESFKLERKIKNKLNLIIHLKAHEKEGGKQKFSVHMRLEYPGRIITSSQDDWDLETALRKTFNNAKNATSKRFKE